MNLLILERLGRYNNISKKKIIKVYILCNAEGCKFLQPFKTDFCAFFEFTELFKFC